MSRSSTEITCDEPDCSTTPMPIGTCSRCVRENDLCGCSDTPRGDLKECFHACSAHETSVNLAHRRIRGRDVEWTGGYLGLVRRVVADEAEVEQDPSDRRDP